MKKLRLAAGLIIALTLAGCAGPQLSLGGSAAPQPAAPQPAIDMQGRWRLAVPGAPSCGIHLSGGSGIRTGAIKPEGGCPGKFFTARHWRLTKDGQKLAIDDYQMNPLADLQRAGDRFTGKSNAGQPVTLSRYSSPLSGSSWQNSSSTASPSPATPTAPR